MQKTTDEAPSSHAPAQHARITADQRVPLVRIEREFAASPAAVFEAHAQPELFAQWVGPRSLDTTIDYWDCRRGGSWRYVARRDDDEFWFRGCFHDVVPGTLIVQTFTFEGFPEGVALERLEFAALSDGRTLLTATSLVDSFEGRDAFLASGMEAGVNEGYEKLDELLARRL